MSRGVAGRTGIDEASRSGLKIVQAVARRKSVLRIRRAGRGGSLRAAAKVRLDVLDGRDGGLRRLVFQSPGLLRAVNLTQIVDASGLLCFESCAHEVWNCYGRQQSDDGHHDHDFHECKSPGPKSLDLHKQLLSRFWLCRLKKQQVGPEIPFVAQQVVLSS